MEKASEIMKTSIAGLSTRIAAAGAFIAALIIIGCSESTSPTTLPRGISVAPDGRPDLRPSALFGGLRSTTFTLTSAGGSFDVGMFTVNFPANSVCDPNASSYGPGTWDSPCDTLDDGQSVTVTATYGFTFSGGFSGSIDGGTGVGVGSKPSLGSAPPFGTACGIAAWVGGGGVQEYALDLGNVYAAGESERAVARWQQLVADPAAPLSVDDRSDAMASLRETLEALGRHDDAIAVAEKQRALLDDTAAKAPTPLAAMTYTWPRADVYAYLGKPLDLVPSIEKLAAVLPGEYDPPARLGWLYLQADRLDDAAKWTDRALAKVYGPRKARLLGQRADIAAKAGDKAGERRYRTQVVELWESLPPAQQSADALAKAKQALAGSGSGT